MLFVEGMEKHGRQWNLLSEMIPTRTAVQIRSHAQKYLKKLEKQQRKAIGVCSPRQERCAKQVCGPSHRTSSTSAAPATSKHCQCLGLSCRCSHQTKIIMRNESHMAQQAALNELLYRKSSLFSLGTGSIMSEKVDAHKHLTQEGSLSLGNMPLHMLYSTINKLVTHTPRNTYSGNHEYCSAPRLPSEKPTHHFGALFSGPKEQYDTTAEYDAASGFSSSDYDWVQHGQSAKRERTLGVVLSEELRECDFIHYQSRAKRRRREYMHCLSEKAAPLDATDNVEHDLSSTQVLTQCAGQYEGLGLHLLAQVATFHL